MQRKRIAARAALAAGALAIITPSAAAQAAVSVDSSGANILVTGTAAADTVTITPQGPSFRIAAATVAGGSSCQASGADVLCTPDKPLRVDLGGGDDKLDNRSQVGGTFFGGDGSDVLRNAPTAVVASELQGGFDDDFFVIGASLGPDLTFGGPGTDMTDYLERGAGQLGGSVVVRQEADEDSLFGAANDGGVNEADNINDSEIVRGTAQAGDDISAQIIDGDLGADKLIFGSATFGLDTPYPRPAVAGPARSTGIEVDLDARTSSDGDTLSALQKVIGTPFADTFRGAGTFEGLGGDDTFHARARTGSYTGGDGNDTVTYAEATEGVTAIMGSQTEFPAEVNNTQLDRIRAVENLVGSPHADQLTGNADVNRIDGGAGGDRIDGGPGAVTDTLEAGPGSDVVDYSNRNTSIVADLSGTLPVAANEFGKPEDTVSGFEGATGGGSFDWLIGSEGDNVLRGGGGQDLLQGRGGADQLFGDDGRDYATYHERTAGIAASLVSNQATDGDTFAGLEGLCGSAGADVLTDGAGAEILVGLGGDDKLRGAAGADKLFGDQPAAAEASPFPACSTTPVSGNDTVSYDARTSGVNAALSGALVNLANSDGDFIDGNVENLTGGSGDDKLVGNGGANVIDGGPGTDLIDGGKGNDRLIGNTGSDGINQFVNLGTAVAPKFSVDTTPAADGVDTIRGDAGNDSLSSVDGVKDDVVVCGSGEDKAAIDLLDPTAAADCETQQRAQIDTHPVTHVLRRAQQGRRLTLTVTCPKLQSKQMGNACKGTAVIRKGRNGATLGSTRYSIRQGRSGKVTVTLRTATRKGLVAILTEVQRNKRKRTATVKLG